MQLTDSLFSYVNRWECDENDHMNVQFYAAKFEEANRHFLQSNGVDINTFGPRLMRHIRYHREAHDATILNVASGVCFDSPYEFTVVHQMNDYSEGTLLATALDGYSLPADLSNQFKSKFANSVITPLDVHLPRGFDCTPTNLNLSAQQLLEKGALPVHHNTLMSRNCGPQNKPDDLFFVGCFSDGAAHMWERTPLNRKWLDHHRYGRIALEMKLCYGTPIGIGSSIKIISGLIRVTTKTFGFRHHVFDVASGKIVVTGDIIAAVLDLDGRQAVNIPAASIEKMNSLLIE